MEATEKQQKIATIIVELAETIYGEKKPDLFGSIINQTVRFKQIDPDDEFMNGLLGFHAYAIEKKIDDSSILTTFIHDLGEFEKGRNEAWFCPRSSGYVKFYKS